MGPVFGFPAVIVQIFVGLIAIGLGFIAIEKVKLLPIKIFGLLVVVGGTIVALEPFPNSWLSPGWMVTLKTVMMILLFTSGAVLMWRTSVGRGSKIFSGALVLIGFVALIVELSTFVAIPGGYLGDVLQAGVDGFRRIARLFVSGIS